MSGDADRTGSGTGKGCGHIVDGWAAEVQKQYAAGLEMRRPGGACLKLGP